MTSRSLPKQVEEQVLIRARRRCCICYGLNRSTEIKKGQIAHINQNSEDNRPENLVFLCLVHHDEYDSSTSQSKGLTAIEIRHFREELDEGIKTLLQSSAGIQERKESISQSPHGLWRREGPNEKARFRVMRLTDGRYHLDGFALWGLDRPYGPNTGVVDFTVDLKDDQAVHTEKLGDTEAWMSLQFQGYVLEVETKNSHIWGGMNVFFDGTYTKVSDDPFGELDS